MYVRPSVGCRLMDGSGLMLLSRGDILVELPWLARTHPVRHDVRLQSCF
jgi:hypothetical protein